MNATTGNIGMNAVIVAPPQRRETERHNSSNTNVIYTSPTERSSNQHLSTTQQLYLGMITIDDLNVSNDIDPVAIQINQNPQQEDIVEPADQDPTLIENLKLLRPYAAQISLGFIAFFFLIMGVANFDKSNDKNQTISNSSNPIESFIEDNDFKKGCLYIGATMLCLVAIYFMKRGDLIDCFCPPRENPQD